MDVTAIMKVCPVAKAKDTDTKIRPATRENIALATSMLDEGGVIAIPTDTVYGLAANALDKHAVARIFEIKGRPENKPLIILVNDILAAKKLARFNPLALSLAENFWPGALTLAVPRFKDCPLPEIVTAGYDSLALRVPKNPAALALLDAFHGPIAVTSANRSGTLDAVTAVQVSSALRDDVDLILDGGQSAYGTASTVLDVQVDTPVILREGAVSRQALEDFLGHPIK